MTTTAAPPKPRDRAARLPDGVLHALERAPVGRADTEADTEEEARIIAEGREIERADPDALACATAELRARGVDDRIVFAGSAAKLMEFLDATDPCASSV